MPLSEFSERKRWNIYVKPETIRKVKELVLLTGANNIGQCLEDLIDKAFEQEGSDSGEHSSEKVS